MDSTTQLAVAELVIYIPLLFCTHYILYKHGRRGLEGWVLMCVFCLLRIVAAILQIIDWNEYIKKGKIPSNTASIVNSVGLSGLLLSCCGLIREAATYAYGHNRNRGIILLLFNHIAIGSGIALAVVGATSLSNAESQKDVNVDKALVIIGNFIILTDMILQFIWFIMTHLALGSSKGHVLPSVVRQARILNASVAIALIILLARLVENLVFGFTLNRKLSSYTGTIAVKVVFVTLVQLIAVLVLLGAGWVTRDIRTDMTKNGRRSVPGISSEQEGEMNGPWK